MRLIKEVGSMSLRPIGVGEEVRFTSEEPEPVGTVVLLAFRVVGYDKDADGSMMARMESVDLDGEASGWEVDGIGLCPDNGVVVSLEELRELKRGMMEPTPTPTTNYSFPKDDYIDRIVDAVHRK